MRKHADNVRLVRPGSASSPERFIMNQTNLGFDMVGVGIYIYMDIYVGILSRRLNKVQYKLK